MQGSELRALRDAAGMTQGELAAQMGMSRGYIGELERGEKSIEERTEKLIRYATGPYQYLIDCTVTAGLQQKIRDLLDEIDAAVGYEAATVAAAVRLGGGELMLGMRRRS